MEGGEKYLLHKCSSSLADMASFKGMKISAPSAFTWQDNPMYDHIWKLSNGEYVTDYDVAINKCSGKTYYVNQDNGNDTNDGLTPTTALKTLKAAHDKTDVVVIIVCSGWLYFGNGMNGSDITKSLTVRTYLGRRVLITTHQYVSWVLTSGKSYTYQVSDSYAGRVFDVNRFTDDMDYFPYQLVASIDACEATEDSYYFDGAILYAHAKGGAKPASNVFYGRTNKNALKVNLTAPQNLYFENIDFIGGISAFGDTNKLSNIYYKNCRAMYADYLGCFGNTRMNSILQNCIASYSVTDGFAYDEDGKHIEINCTGRYNGLATVGVNNGSTSHGGSKVIRLNGVYHNNGGPNVVDVQANTQSWNIGCLAYDSKATDTQCCDYQSQDTTPEMWLENCTGYGSIYSVKSANDAKIYVRGGDFSRLVTNINTYPIAEY